MKKELKAQVIENISAQLKETPNFYVTDISGLNAEDTSKLRRACFEKGIKLSVVKNTLFNHVIKTIGNDELYDALSPAYILQSDGNWHKVPQNQPKAYVGAFRSYFQSATANAARLLATAFSSSADTQGITVLRTTDADGTQHYYDLSGRRLSGKPQQGMYIYNGKKYMNK